MNEKISDIVKAGFEAWCWYSLPWAILMALYVVIRIVALVFALIEAMKR